MRHCGKDGNKTIDTVRHASTKALDQLKLPLGFAHKKNDSMRRGVGGGGRGVEGVSHPVSCE